MSRLKHSGQSLPQTETADRRHEDVKKGAVPNSKLADLIASGARAVPAGLSDEDTEQLHSEVSTIRRSRLIRWIARCIADRLLQQCRSVRKKVTHVRK